MLPRVESRLLVVLPAAERKILASAPGRGQRGPSLPLNGWVCAGVPNAWLWCTSEDENTGWSVGVGEAASAAQTHARLWALA